MESELMRAVVITAPRTAVIQNIRRWSPGPGDVLIRSHNVAICTAERRMFSGAQSRFYPAIAGHELAGVVEWADESQSALKRGDHVALDVMIRCGHCYYCIRGRNNLCIDMYKTRKESECYIAGGGFAELLCVPAYKAVKLPQSTDLEQASLVEPLACCLRSIKKAQLSFGDTVAILGAGTMGSLHTLLAKLWGARTIVTDIDEARLKFVKELGADVTVNPLQDDPVQAVKDLTDGRGADAVIVTASAKKAGQQALTMVARAGHIVIYSSLHPSEPLDLDWNRIHYEEITITGTESKTDRDFREAAALLGSGAVNLRPLISKVISLDELPAELASSPTGETQRVVVSV